MTTNNQDKLVFRIVLSISLIVFIAVIILNKKILPRPEIIPLWVNFLPKLNAMINATCSVLLLLSLYFIKQKSILVHKKINIVAFCLSSIFLISYIVFHWLVEETHYPENAPMRSFYYIILISHIILAAVVLPLILLSFYRGLQMQVEKHKKLVRYAFPVWLYVTITGVLVYLMISPYYTF